MIKKPLLIFFEKVIAFDLNQSDHIKEQYFHYDFLCDLLAVLKLFKQLDPT